MGRWDMMKFWDPTIGCTPISEGCMMCSSANHINRMEFSGLCDKIFNGVITKHNGIAKFNGIIKFNTNAFDEVKDFKHNEEVFVCGRSDLFHKDVPFDYIDRVIESSRTRADCTFYAITKRAERMAEYCESRLIPTNFWIGISTENQDRFNQRVPYLSKINAIKAVNAKPLLGPIVLHSVGLFDMLIVGGETGNKARKMDPQWVRSLRDQCLETHKPFSFHGWGAWMPHGDIMVRCGNNRVEQMLLDGIRCDQYPEVCNERR